MISNEAEFNRMFALVENLYPHPGTSELSASAYWHVLEDLPFDAIKAAVHKIPVKFEQRMPTAPQLRRQVEELAAKQKQLQAEQRRSRLLAEPETKQDDALQALYKFCDDGLRRARNKPWEDGDDELVEGLLVHLGRAFGLNREQMVGNPDSDEPHKRFNNAYALRIALKASVSAESVIRAIRKAPQQFSKFPAHGMLVALARGGASQDWHAEPTRKPKERSNKFELLAQKWEQESRALGLDPNKPTPPEIYQRRMGECWDTWESKDG